MCGSMPQIFDPILNKRLANTEPVVDQRQHAASSVRVGYLRVIIVHYSCVVPQSFRAQHAAWSV